MFESEKFGCGNREIKSGEVCPRVQSKVQEIKIRTRRTKLFPSVLSLLHFLPEATVRKFLLNIMCIKRNTKETVSCNFFQRNSLWIIIIKR